MGRASERFAILAAEAESSSPGGQSAPRRACRADCQGPPAQGYAARGRGERRSGRPGRPIYRNPAPPPTPAARRRCARTLRREEYTSLSAYFRAPISGGRRRIPQIRKFLPSRLMSISAGCIAIYVFRYSALMGRLELRVGAHSRAFVPTSPVTGEGGGPSVLRF